MLAATAILFLRVATARCLFEMEDTITDLREDIRDFRREVNDKHDKLDARLRPVEQVAQAARIICGIAVVAGPILLAAAFK